MKRLTSNNQMKMLRLNYNNLNKKIISNNQIKKVELKQHRSKLLED